MNKREKTYVIIIIFLLLALTVKTLFLDEVKNLTKEEEMFKEYVYKLIDEKYDNFFKRNNLITFRVVSIKKLAEEGTSIIEVKDGDNNIYKQVEIPGKYKARVRKYLFYIIPYGEDRVLSRK